MKTVLLSVLAIVSVQQSSAFWFVPSFDDQCKSSDFVVRAEVIRTVDLFPHPVDAQISRALAGAPIKVQVFRTTEVIKRKSSWSPKLFFVPTEYYAVTDPRPIFKQDADVILFLHELADGYYVLDNPGSYFVVSDGKVIFVSTEKGADGKYKRAQSEITVDRLIEMIKRTLKSG